MSNNDNGYFNPRTGQYANLESLSLEPLGGTSIAADTLSRSVEMADRANLRLTMTCTSMDALDDLDVIVQGSQDNSTWFTLFAFAQLTSVTSGAETLAGPCARFVRINYDKTGTNGAAVVTVAGEAA